MSRNKLVANLEMQHEKLIARKKAVIAKLNLARQKEQQRERRNRNRRLLLIGIAVQQAERDGKIREEQINKLLDSYITSKKDREFLGINTLTIPSA